MRVFLSCGFFLLLLVASPGCSLLEVKLENNIKPLPQDQLSMRVFTREYANTFFAGVEQTADVLMTSDDISSKAHALQWKIAAEQTLGQTIYQVSPVAAMIDTWAFTAQMAAFFTSGNGSRLFGERTMMVAETCQRLLTDYERRMKDLTSETGFTTNQAFIDQYVTDNPLFDVTFSRVSAFNDWLRYHHIEEIDAVTTFGSVPEVMSDMSDRMAMLATQTPKILGWKAELFALHADIDWEMIHQALTDISETSMEFQELMMQSPQMMSELAVDMRRELTPLLDQLDADVETKMVLLSAERMALENMVERERAALEQLVVRERQAIAREADDLMQRTVAQVFAQGTEMLSSLILYIIMLILVIFFAPLGLGVWLGRKIGLRQERRKSP